jgi:YgiT-type zinc finger domain-containing protein
VKCTVCGAALQATRTDLPFKVRETAIVILKGLPVLQCRSCPEYLIEDTVLGRVDEILASLGSQAELEIIRYAA